MKFWYNVDAVKSDDTVTAVKRYLSPQTVIPHSFQYCYTPRNCLVEDDKALHNIPYLGDNQAATQEMEGSVLQTLIESYDGLIHDNRTVNTTQTTISKLN